LVTVSESLYGLAGERAPRTTILVPSDAPRPEGPVGVGASGTRIARARLPQ